MLQSPALLHVQESCRVSRPQWAAVHSSQWCITHAQSCAWVLTFCLPSNRAALRTQQLSCPCLAG